MANERTKQMMQEALDNALTPEAFQELLRHLDYDLEDAAQFSRLKQVDVLLRTAPSERAPARLALKIMARLSESVKAEAEQKPDISGLALTLGVSLVVVVMMPMMMAASWLVLNMMASPAILTELIQQAIALLVLVINAMKTLLEEAERLVATDPKAAELVLALIPLVLLGFVRYLEDTL